MYERWTSKKEKILVKGTENVCPKTVKESTIISKLEAVKLLDEKLVPFMKHCKYLSPISCNTANKK